MSSFDAAYIEFFQESRIEHAIFNIYKGPKDYKITIYCLKKNIDINREKRRLVSVKKTRYSLPLLGMGH